MKGPLHGGGGIGGGALENGADDGAAVFRADGKGPIARRLGGDGGPAAQRGVAEEIAQAPVGLGPGEGEGALWLGAGQLFKQGGKGAGARGVAGEGEGLFPAVGPPRRGPRSRGVDGILSEGFGAGFRDRGGPGLGKAGEARSSGGAGAQPAEGGADEGSGETERRDRGGGNAGRRHRRGRGGQPKKYN